MRNHLEFIAGIIILFFMAVVLWKFMTPEPKNETIKQQPVEQSNEQQTFEGNSPIETGFTVHSGVEGENQGQVPPELAPVEEDIEQPVACTMEAKMCPDGSFVGRQGPNCEFAPCPGESAGEKVVSHCGPRLSEPIFCTEQYEPVCAQVQVECVTTPCDPVSQTYSNSCFACANDRVLSYTEGDCEE